jgi:hypothetical protein
MHHSLTPFRAGTCSVCGRTFTTGTQLGTWLSPFVDHRPSDELSVCPHHRSFYECGFIAIVELDRRFLNLEPTERTDPRYLTAIHQVSHVRRDLADRLWNRKLDRTTVALDVGPGGTQELQMKLKPGPV